MNKENCIFCEIAAKNARASIVYEDEKFIAFDNIHPHAPVHVLVVPKDHIEKTSAINGEISNFWSEIMGTVNKVIEKLGLDKSGYRLVNNGGGYHAINHEHIHILGGKDWSPKDGL